MSLYVVRRLDRKVSPDKCKRDSGGGCLCRSLEKLIKIVCRRFLYLNVWAVMMSIRAVLFLLSALAKPLRLRRHDITEDVELICAIADYAMSVQEATSILATTYPLMPIGNRRVR